MATTISSSSPSSSLFNFLVPSKPKTLISPNTISLKSSPSKPTKINSTPNDNVSSVVYPALANANTMFFRSAYNVQVIVEDNEPEEKLLNRFRREVFRAGIIQEAKRRRFFENKQEEKKRRTRDAAKRNRKRRPFSRMPVQDKEEGSKKKDDDGDDNWDYPQN